jgi:DNA-binding response OmpR family regulator
VAAADIKDRMGPAAPKTILICEDEPDLRELVRAACGAQYLFEDTADGVEALAVARRDRPDLIVLDLMLPRKSGVEVLEELRADSKLRETPVVVVTAWTETRERAMAAGADRFLTKPFDPDELKATVDEFLAGR